MARGAPAPGPGLGGTPFEAVVRVVDVDVLVGVVGLAVGLVTLVEVEVSSVAMEAGGG